MPESTQPEGPEQRAPRTDRGLVGSLLHGLEILEMFGRDRPTIGIGEMARKLDLHKSSASRLAATLAAAGYLEAADSRGLYRLGGRLAALGQLAAQNSDIERTVLPFLAKLTSITGETGHLALLDGAQARTVAVTDGWHTVRMHSWVGKTSPAYCSSMGKALLAGLGDDEVRALYPDGRLPTITERTTSTVVELLADLARLRENGYGFDDEELETGLRCISAPIIGYDDSVVASISVSGPSQRITDDAITAIAEHVRWAAAAASRALGAPTGTAATWAPAPTVEPAPLPWVEEVRSALAAR